LFQAHYNNHGHDRNYANEKVVLANHRTRTERELRDGGFCVVVEMCIRDPDEHADASGETKGFWHTFAEQPVARRTDLVKQLAFEYSNHDSTKVAARFLDRCWKSWKSVSKRPT
jgi:hypothetical protein